MIIFYSLLGILLLLIIRALSLSTSFIIEQSTQITCEVPVVFEYVKDLKNHRNFNKWLRADPAVTIHYTSPDAAVGSQMHWISELKNVGEGIQKIEAITKNEQILFVLNFIKPFEDTSTVFIKMRAESEGTCTVTWGLTGNRKFMQKFMQVIFNFDKMLRNDLRISLDNLKLILEK